MANLCAQVADVVEREFYDASFLSAEWPRVKAEHLGRYAAASTVTEREAAINDLIATLKVSHSMLITPEMAASVARQESDPERLKPILRSTGTTLLASIRSMRVRTTTLAELRRLVEACQGTRNLVLDFRLNDGGAGSVASELASVFLPAETPVMRVRDRIGQDLNNPLVVHSFPEQGNADHEIEIAALQEHHYVEYRTKADPIGRYDGNIVVVVDRRCYSCGEVFVQCMKEFSPATIVGRPSAGFVVAAQEYDLSDGYALLLPFAEIRSGMDVFLEGTGGSPNISLDVDAEDDDRSSTN